MRRPRRRTGSKGPAASRRGRVAVFWEATPRVPVDLRGLVRQILCAERRPKQVNVIVAGDLFLRRLNRQFRRKDRPTDVLAFAGEGDLLGEVYVSVTRARIQARRFEVTLASELRRLVAHGLFHLLGFTHRTMRRRVEQAAR